MKIVIGEDQALMREGLAILLENAGFSVAGLAADGDGLVRAARAHNPDIVIADVRMPPTFTDEGLRAALAIRQADPQIAILVLTQHVHRQIAAELVESGEGRRGTGYLLKQRIADVDSFCSDLRRISEGASVVDPEVVSAMLGRARRDDPVERLSARQREVLALMAEGRSNSAIAERLCLTTKAVTKQVSQIYDELGLPPAADDHRRVLAVMRFLNR